MDKPWTHLPNKVVESNPGAYRCYMGIQRLGDKSKNRTAKSMERSVKSTFTNRSKRLQAHGWNRNPLIQVVFLLFCKSASEARPGSSSGTFPPSQEPSQLAWEWLDLEICAFAGILVDFEIFQKHIRFKLCLWNLFSRWLQVFLCVCLYTYILHIESSWCVTCRCCRNPRPTALAFWVRPGHQLHPPLADSGITPWWQGMLSSIPPYVKLAKITANLQSKLNF